MWINNKEREDRPPSCACIVILGGSCTGKPRWAKCCFSPTDETWCDALFSEFSLHCQSKFSSLFNKIDLRPIIYHAILYAFLSVNKSICRHPFLFLTEHACYLISIGIQYTCFQIYYSHSWIHENFSEIVCIC